MLTPYLPYPPASGGQIRTLNLLKNLSRNHDITLVALYKNEKEKKFAEHLKPFCKAIYVCKRAENPWQLSNVFKSVFSFLPFLIVRNYSYEAQHVVHDLLAKEQFDVIHAETFYIMPHIPRTNVPILLVEQTIEFKVYQHFVSNLTFILKYLLYIDILKLKFWEVYYWKKATQVATVSYDDKAIIDTHIQQNSTEVIPNGAGDEMFVKTLPKKDLKKPVLLFVGNFSWLQNTEAAEYLIEKILPELVKKIPNITLRIAGQLIREKSNIPSSPNIEVLDLAPDDNESIIKAYKESTLFVAPIFGPGGTRLKILAAMASGLPIVSSKTGVDGLNVKDGKDVVVAKSVKEFIEQITGILNDEQRYYELQKNAFDVVSKQYSWHAIAEKLEIVYQESKKA